MVIYCTELLRYTGYGKRRRTVIIFSARTMRLQGRKLVLRVRERLLTIHLMDMLREQQEYVRKLKLELQTERKESAVMSSESSFVFQGNRPLE